MISSFFQTEPTDLQSFLSAGSTNVTRSVFYSDICFYHKLFIRKNQSQITKYRPISQQFKNTIFVRKSHDMTLFYCYPIIILFLRNCKRLYMKYMNFFVKCIFIKFTDSHTTHSSYRFTNYVTQVKTSNAPVSCFHKVSQRRIENILLYSILFQHMIPGFDGSLCPSLIPAPSAPSACWPLLPWIQKPVRCF